MEKYKKQLSYSYTFGLFPTFELVKNKPSLVQKILLHDKLIKSDDVQKLLDLAKKHNITIETNSKLIQKIGDKDNIMCIGVFEKYESILTKDKNHLLLANPSDMGNMGTIMRTALGFDICDIAILSPCVDIFNPKVIRASMGAIFSLNLQIFEALEKYQENHKNHLYPFMLQANTVLSESVQKHSPFTLVFGNESSGLESSFLQKGTPLIIKHSKNIDSLNLPISVSIALYEFCK